MKTSNSIIENMEAVRIRAEELNCNVVAVLGNVILCARGDNTFITWRCSIYDGNKAEFISGCYDMEAYTAGQNLIERAYG